MYFLNLVENFNLLTQQMHETPLKNTTMGSISYLFHIPTNFSPIFLFHNLEDFIFQQKVLQPHITLIKLPC